MGFQTQNYAVVHLTDKIGLWHESMRSLARQRQGFSEPAGIKVMGPAKVI
jgi:hypothetical protein